MALGIKEDRPPYVQFENKQVEDRTATIEAGHYVSRDVHYAMITPQGSKDRIQRVVVDWFDHLEREVREGRFSGMWLQSYRGAYEAWKKGQEIPLEGTSVRNWPFPSPSQVQLMQDLHLLTVEDVAGANEESVRRLGMGGQSLKQAAIDFLGNIANSGKNAKDMDVLRQENESLKVRSASLEEQVRELAAQVRALSPQATMKAI